MGVDRTDYLMWAVDVGYKNFEWDLHGDEADGAPGRKFDLIYDGMCGQYAMAGHIIAVSDAYDEGFDKVTITPEQLSADRSEMAAAVSAAFPNQQITEDSFSLILFSHFH